MRLQMNVFHLSGRDLEDLDPSNFTGEGTLVRMIGVCSSPAVNAYRVAFEAGTRTAWHTHTGPQLLVVTDGRCRFQRKGGPVQEVEAGGVVSIEPGEMHWHGASVDAGMTHLALNIDAETAWFEKVADDEYGGP
jgi:quercetin dioxygenase-like cupin family protein